MADIIEILFENIEFDALPEFLRIIEEDSCLVRSQISVGNNQSKETISNLPNLIENLGICNGGAVYLNYANFKISGILLPEVGMQILKYNGCVDLSIDIEYNYFQKIKSLISLREWVEIKSNQLFAINYCCGYEPASDFDTSFFTKNKLGPLIFK